MWNWIEKLSELQRAEQPFALISVIKCLGSSPCKEGAKMIVREDGEFWGTVGGGRLEFMLLDFAADAIKKGTFQRHDSCRQGYAGGCDRGCRHKTRNMRKINTK